MTLRKRPTRRRRIRPPAPDRRFLLELAAAFLVFFSIANVILAYIDDDAGQLYIACIAWVLAVGVLLIARGVD